MEAIKKEETLSPKLIVSVGPHVKDEETIQRIMWSVSLALLPSSVMAAYYFGPRALAVMIVSILSALGAEAVTQKVMGKPITISDGSAFLTGLLLSLNLPSGIPLYLPIIGNVVAIVITKQLFGGLGFNVFNPALIGRALLLTSWPRLMTTWYKPVASLTSLDAITTATPLGVIKEAGAVKGMEELLKQFGSISNMYTEMLIGNRAGSLGETSIIALLIGAAFLLYKRYITWHIPFSFLATVAVLSWVVGVKDPVTGNISFFTGDPLLSLLSGGLILGAFFMATDYVTVPVLRRAQIAFGIGCGLLTILIRRFGGYPEGVCYAILLMNCFTPLLDRWFKRRKFGFVKERK